MNGTPRLRSSFPSTPRSVQKTPRANAASGREDETKLRSPLPTAPGIPSTSSILNAPVIPVTLLDAPSQRMYTLAIYGILLVWRLYDWYTLIEADTISAGLFMKWTIIDLVFSYGVPLLRIPWLEWSETTSTVSSLVHAVVNAMLMFRMPLPIEGWLLFMTKTLFDKELSISENSVRVSSILHNSSLIMGKQIIKVLPEGSATMNPDVLSFCISSSQMTVNIPLRFNQTKPREVEILRIDLDTNSNETIILSARDIKRRHLEDDGISVINFTAKKTGLYRLLKVIDETKLEVQRRLSETLVVNCPKGAVRSPASDKCLGDLSDLTMEIEGTPPLKIVYTRTTNQDQSIHHFQNIQPENFASPLVGATKSGAIVLSGSTDISWARTQRIIVPLNESMSTAGKWLYSIDEIHDAAGNVANFSSGTDDGEHTYPKGANLEQAFTVYQRPLVQLTGCDSRNPLMVAKTKSVQLPVRYTSSGRGGEDMSHTITWKFSPLNTLTKTGDHGDDATIVDFVARTSHIVPTIQEPGLYSLTGVSSKFCEGEVKEPASCLLLNPPEPELSITSENISDKCAGNSIGLLVDLDLIGTPPFIVRYDIVTKGGTRSEQVKVPGLRYQLELKPQSAGHFKYHFTSLDDSIYLGHSLSGKGLVLEQDVKPPASASLRIPPGRIDACIEEAVEANVVLSGEQPFTLEYELVHEGKRKKVRVPEIHSNNFKIVTDPLQKGGEYSLALTSVQDKTGCKIFVNSEIKFTVRRQRPRAFFGQLEGRYKTTEVEGRPVDLPLRLTGDGPWMVKYRHADDKSGNILETVAKSENAWIRVTQMGTYEITEVSDGQCPGSVDSTKSTFEVDWFPRPQFKLADTGLVTRQGAKFIKREVCEGDIDAAEVNLIGASPYHVKYQIRHKPDSGTSSISNKEFDAALGATTISMDTSKPGIYEYKFTELSDTLYDHDSKKFTPLTLEQKVNKKPSARFTKPGQSYKYCKEELAGDEIIPIKLDGVPPFSLEIDIKHQSSSRPETVKIANIESNRYDFKIPHNVLSLGVHQVSVRKVRDSHGCQQKTEFGAPHVQVQVYDVPTIYPLEARTDCCVGERISYTLSGMAPFEIFYTFEGVQRKAKSQGTTFRRVAEKPGTFSITAISDKASDCKARMDVSKFIHEMPSVKISKGKQVQVDIHEGGEAEILFEFWGTPPFEFTYTRSTNARRGQKSTILETRHEVSEEYSKTIQSSLEGTYEVVAIKDKYCSFSTQKETGGGQKYLTF